MYNIEKGKPKKEILAAEVLVIVEVTKVNGNWKIVNFRYPPFNVKYDLLDILKGLKQDREKNKNSIHPKSATHTIYELAK